MELYYFTVDPFLTHSLFKVAMLHPDAVTSCNSDLENLISDSNRSIATLAITTLLKVHQLRTSNKTTDLLLLPLPLRQEVRPVWSD